MNARLVPEDFEVPLLLQTARFRLRPLTVHDVVKDYDAMISRGAVTEGLTLEQNLIDLGWHQKEFQRRSSFTYTVMSPDEARCLGCLYIYPSGAGEHDAEVHMWVRGDEQGGDLDSILFETVHRWIDERWRLGRVAYPGREGG